MFMVFNATFNNISVISRRLHSIAKIGYGYLFLGEIDLRYKGRSVCVSNYLLNSFEEPMNSLIREVVQPLPPQPKNEVPLSRFKYVCMKSSY